MKKGSFVRLIKSIYIKANAKARIGDKVRLKTGPRAGQLGYIGKIYIDSIDNKIAYRIQAIRQDGEPASRALFNFAKITDFEIVVPNK